MLRNIRILLLFLSTFFIYQKVNATHIVGGVIYYEYLGGNSYKLIFEIYKDCSPSVVVGFDGSISNNPNVQFPKFYFSVFKGNVDVNIQRPNNELLLLDTLIIQPVITNPCLVIDKNTCVVKGRYETTITLPDNTSGYTIQYMRCCRNDGILNIQNQPGSGDKPGITLRTFIPPTGSTPNNSAKFKNFPPIFICVNQQFYFDHSATDKDGDALTYFLTTPLEGLTSNGPTDPIQTLNVNPILWNPGYGVNNILGGTPPMYIDSITGLLVCKPNRVGRFVASILVKETRNGKVIDSFARDFQYNVLECNIPNANLSFIPGTFDPKNNIGVYVTCGDLKTQFDNSSTNADRYEWRFGDPKSGSNNVSTDVTPTHTFSDTGTYIVTLFAFKKLASGQLCVDSTRRICKIYPKIKVNFDFKSDCQNLPIKFTDITSTAGGAISNWEWNFGDGRTALIQNPTNSYLNSGTFNVKLKVTSPTGCISDTTIPVAIYPKPDIKATIPKGCIGYPMDFKCAVTIPSPYIITNYRWTLPSGTKIASCNASYTPMTTANGLVNLWAKSDKGCVDSANFNFVVNPLPSIKAPPDIFICYDKTAQLSASGGVSYEWTPSTYLSNPSIATPISSPPYPDSIIYQLKGTDANGCINFDTVKIKFFIKPFIDAGPDTSICLNSSPGKFKDVVQLTGKGVFSTVYWTPATGLDNANSRTPLARPLINQDYVFNGIDNNNCLIQDTVRVIVLNPALDLIKLKTQFLCLGDSIQVNPEDQGTVSSYKWTPNFWLSNPSIRNPVFRPFDTIMYILTLENYCYIKTDSVLFNVNELPKLMLKDLDSICLGSVYQFSSNPNLTSYLWTTAEPTFSNKTISNPTAKPIVSQKYLLDVTDQYGCKNRDSIQLNVNYPPTLFVANLPRYICLGDSAKLTAIAGLRSTFLWAKNTYLSSDTAQTVYAFPPDTSLYTIRAISYQQCTTIKSFTINVQKNIKPYALRPVRICKGKFIDLYAEGGLYYRWTPNYNINDTLTQTPQVNPDSFVTYQVRISNDCFADSIKVDVYVDSLPIVDAGLDTTIYRGQEIKLNAKYTAENIEWQPKEKINSNIFTNEISVSPRDTTLYYAFVTNGRGCIGKDSVYVYVYGKNVLLIPTGFSPNRDGINDVFRVGKYLNIKKLNYFEVYNRWGEKLWQTNDITKGWDGIYNDLPAPAGTYVWKIEAVNYENERITQSGNVTLIR